MPILPLESLITPSKSTLNSRLLPSSMLLMGLIVSCGIQAQAQVRAQSKPQIQAQTQPIDLDALKARAQTMVQDISQRQMALNKKPIEPSAVDQLNNSVAMTFESPETALLILGSGEIKNQYETAGSGGAFNPKLRRQTELTYAGSSLETAMKGLTPAQQNKISPKYAQLMIHPSQEVAAIHYGTVAFVFKNDVKKRSTWTPGDSLKLERVYGYDSNTYLAESQFNTFTSVHNLPPIDQPDLYAYYEIQIWGPLTSSDVACILIPSDSPADFVAKLSQYKIPFNTYETKPVDPSENIPGNSVRMIIKDGVCGSVRMDQ